MTARGRKRHSIALDIAAEMTARGISGRISVIVEGMPTGATLSAGTNNWDKTWSLNPEDLANLQFLPRRGDSDDDGHVLTVRVLRFDDDGFDVASTVALFDIAIGGAKSKSARNAEGSRGVDRLTAEKTEWAASAEERLAAARAQWENEEAERLRAGQAAWEADAHARLAKAKERWTKTETEQLATSKASWSAESTRRLAEQKAAWQAEAQQRLAADKAAWRREEERALAAAKLAWDEEAGERLAAARAAWEPIADLRLSTAEADWRAELDRRLSKAKAAWRAEEARHVREQHEALASDRAGRTGASPDPTGPEVDLAAERAAWEAEAEQRLRAEELRWRADVEQRIEDVRTAFEGEMQERLKAAEARWRVEEKARLAVVRQTWEAEARPRDGTVESEKAETPPRDSPPPRHDDSSGDVSDGPQPQAARQLEASARRAAADAIREQEIAKTETVQRRRRAKVELWRRTEERHRRTTAHMKRIIGTQSGRRRAVYLLVCGALAIAVVILLIRTESVPRSYIDRFIAAASGEGGGLF